MIRKTSTNIINNYSLAIDGIRAIAVISVIINHFTARILPSGYLGVDIFFVISGFVITNSILNRNELSFKSFIVKFYKRRVKRLIPALLFCFSITALLISFFSIYPKRYILTGLSSLIGLSNINLYLDSVDYWGESAHYNPFTHTWSLGVEEQFYFVFPIFLWLIAKGNFNELNLKKISLFLSLTCLVSMLCFFVVQKEHSMMTYFLMPFRFWEIGLGCLLYIQLKRTNGNFLKSLVEYIPFQIILISLISIFFLPIELKILNNILIVLFTVILILKVKLLENKSKGTILKPLTNDLTVFIGKISYSLYLWHWVIITISNWTIGINHYTILLQIFLIFFFSTFSYYLIEQPLRYLSWRVNIKPKVILLPMLLFILFFSFTIFYWSRNHFFLGNKPTTNINKKTLSQLDSLSTKCSTIRTIGNSHSVHIIPMLKIITDMLNISLIYQKDSDYIVIPSGGKSQMERFESIMGSLNQNDVLILSSRNRYIYQIPYLNAKGEKWLDHSQQKQKNSYGLKKWFKELDEVISKTKSKGINVILFLPNIEFDSKISNAEFYSPQWFRNTANSKTNTVSMEFLNSRFPEEFYNEVETKATLNSNFFVYNPLPLYCSDSTYCSNFKEGIVLFNDTNHLTKEGAMIMLDNFFNFLLENNLL